MQFRRVVVTAVGVAILVAPTVVAAQQANPAVNISSVVRGGVVIVSYDLVSGSSNAVFDVVLDVSSDGGRTYSVSPKTVSGDVGPGVRPGTGKQITWEAARDVENLQVDRFRYRVTANSPNQRAAGPTQSNAPAPLQPGPAVKSGSGRKWAGIALLGAGGAFMVLSNTAMKTDDTYMNKPLMWAGIGAAAGGVTLLALSGKNSSTGTHIVFGPSGIAVQHRLRLPR